MAEADRVNNGVLAAAVVVTSAALIAMVFGVATLFDFTIRAEIDRKVNAVESTQLRQLRVEEQHKITSYQWVDQKAGVVRIPVDRAVELVVAEGYHRPPPPATPPAVPAAAPAAPGAAPAAPGAAPAAPGAAPAGATSAGKAGSTGRNN